MRKRIIRILGATLNLIGGALLIWQGPSVVASLQADTSRWEKLIRAVGSNHEAFGWVFAAVGFVTMTATFVPWKRPHSGGESKRSTVKTYVPRIIRSMTVEQLVVYLVEVHGAGSAHKHDADDKWAVELVKEIQQGAADGHLPVWGRKNRFLPWQLLEPSELSNTWFDDLAAWMIWRNHGKRGWPSESIRIRLWDDVYNARNENTWLYQDPCFTEVIMKYYWRPKPPVALTNTEKEAEKLNALIAATFAWWRGNRDAGPHEIDGFMLTQPNYYLVRDRMRKLDLSVIEGFSPIGGELIHPRILELEDAIRKYKQDKGI